MAAFYAPLAETTITLRIAALLLRTASRRITPTQAIGSNFDMTLSAPFARTGFRLRASLDRVEDGLSRVEVHRQVTRDADLLAEFERFRYRIYIQDLQKSLPWADHRAQRLPDALDAPAYHFVRRNKRGSVAGCVRLHLGTEVPGSAIAPLGLDSFLNHYDRPFGYVSKLMVERSLRGGVVALSLMEAMIETSQQVLPEAEVAFFHCHPKLVRLYEAYGFRRCGAVFDDPHVGRQETMYIVTGDVEHFHALRSPLAEVATKRPISPSRRHWLVGALLRGALTSAQAASHGIAPSLGYASVVKAPPTEALMESSKSALASSHREIAPLPAPPQPEGLALGNAPAPRKVSDGGRREQARNLLN